LNENKNKAQVKKNPKQNPSGNRNVSGKVVKDDPNQKELPNAVKSKMVPISLH